MNAVLCRPTRPRCFSWCSLSQSCSTQIRSPTPQNHGSTIFSPASVSASPRHSRTQLSGPSSRSYVSLRLPAVACSRDIAGLHGAIHGDVRQGSRALDLPRRVDPHWPCGQARTQCKRHLLACSQAHGSFGACRLVSVSIWAADADEGVAGR